MSKILFDLTATQPSHEAKFHGGSEYAKAIFIEAINNGYTEFDCVYDINLELNPIIIDLCRDKKIELIPISSSLEIEKVINDNNYRKFYSSLPYQFCKFKIESTTFYMDVLGLRSLEMPSDFYEIYYLSDFYSKIKKMINLTIRRKIVQRKVKKEFDSLMNIKNKHILTISNHSKYSILNFYPSLKNEEISVSYAPIDFSDFKDEDEVKGQYFLLVSANRWVKNNYRAILALDSLFSEGKLKGKKVLVLGLKNKNQFKIKNKEKFIIKDYVSDDSIKKYYKEAFCLIYPTLNEGFGYPPLQAMKYKTPVIASAISAVPEVCQNAVLYFNPYSISEIKNRILQISENNKLYFELQNRGVERLLELKLQQEIMFKVLVEKIFKIELKDI